MQNLTNIASRVYSVLYNTLLSRLRHWRSVRTFVIVVSKQGHLQSASYPVITHVDDNESLWLVCSDTGHHQSKAMAASCKLCGFQTFSQLSEVQSVLLNNASLGNLR